MTNIPPRIGNYRLERRIGKGGMSEVWLARHRSLEDRKVAIKLLLSQDSEWIERFTREANITSRLRHENIIQIYDHGEQAPFHYTTMEYVEGGALREVLKAHIRLGLDQALHIFRCAGLALDYAHAHGVIHRDVSPGNILLEQSSGRVLLTDFGIARESGKVGVTTINKVMGTPGYLSPEHASSATSVTHLSDLYSLGVVLFEMLSGRLPWDHTPGMPPEANGGPFIPPKLLRDCSVVGLPPDVDRVLQTMMALEPTKRYPSAQAAIDDLDQVLQHHTSRTQVVVRKAPPADLLSKVEPLPPHPVETVLALDLLKGPMQEARRRADSMVSSEDISQLLDQWSGESWLRRPLLGRQAVIRRVTSTNIYYYRLRVLYEVREPVKTIEEPDRAAAPIQLERTIDRWGVELPPPKGFGEETGGTLVLPGSMRVVACEVCKGIGRTVCQRCKGQGRIKTTRPVPDAGGKTAAAKAPDPKAPDPRAPIAAAPTAKPPTVGGPNPAPAASGTGTGVAAATAAATAPAEVKTAEVVVPCPECSGSGAQRCQRCDGVGRLLEKKTTSWRRFGETFDTNDDLPHVDEEWLLRACKLTDVYKEQQVGGFRAEWHQVPALAELLELANKKTDQNTRVAMSEVAISFIPMTEIMFDLGRPSRLQKAARAKELAEQAPGENDPAEDERNLYRWHVYGFEQRLPADWRFLNWDRLMALIMVGWVALLLALIIVLLLRG
jgi:serine/threonine protein kinase